MRPRAAVGNYSNGKMADCGRKVVIKIEAEVDGFLMRCLSIVSD